MSWGVDGETGCLSDMSALGICEPLAVKAQTYKTAVEVRTAVKVWSILILTDQYRYWRSALVCFADGHLVAAYRRHRLWPQEERQRRADGRPGSRIDPLRSSLTQNNIRVTPAMCVCMSVCLCVYMNVWGPEDSMKLNKNKFGTWSSSPVSFVRMVFSSL